MDVDNPKLIIDRKKDLLEICGNITQQHERFKRELIRAQKQGIHLIILCENGQGIEEMADVIFWENPRLSVMEWKVVDGRPMKTPKYPKATKGPALYKAMRTMSQEYGVEWLFCSKRETGAKIKELLERRGDNGKERICEDTPKH